MFGIFNDLLMRIKIRHSESVGDDLNGFLNKNSKPVIENNKVMLCLFITAIGLIVVVFIVGISL